MRTRSNAPTANELAMSQSQSHVQSHGPICALCRRCGDLDGVDSLTPVGSVHTRCDQMKQKYNYRIVAPRAALWGRDRRVYDAIRWRIFRQIKKLLKRSRTMVCIIVFWLMTLFGEAFFFIQIWILLHIRFVYIWVFHRQYFSFI